MTPGSSMTMWLRKYESQAIGRKAEAGRLAPPPPQPSRRSRFPIASCLNGCPQAASRRDGAAGNLAAAGRHRSGARCERALELVAGPLGKHVGIFSDVAANPTEDDVLAGLNAYRALACDGLVAIGGGSAIDAAKAIRLLVTHPGRLADYDLTRGGLEKITAVFRPWRPFPRQPERAVRSAEER